MNLPLSRQFASYAGRHGRREPTAAPVLREAVYLFAALTMYFGVRGFIRGRETVAFANAVRLIDLERWFGFFWEPSLQRWALTHDWIVTAANWIYVWTYWPVLAGTMLWLVLRHGAVAAIYRNALLISGAIGLAGFTLFPLAPPRFVSGLGFVDTVAAGSDVYQTLYPGSVANWYAAMPSLHVGWTLLMGIAIASHAGNRSIRAIAITLPLAMFAATVLTANHYLADGVVGMMAAVAGLTSARQLHLAGFGGRNKGEV